MVVVTLAIAGAVITAAVLGNGIEAWTFTMMVVVTAAAATGIGMAVRRLLPSRALT